MPLFLLEESGAQKGPGNYCDYAWGESKEEEAETVAAAALAVVLGERLMVNFLALAGSQR